MKCALVGTTSNKLLFSRRLIIVSNGHGVDRTLKRQSMKMLITLTRRNDNIDEDHGASSKVVYMKKSICIMQRHAK